MGDRVRVYELSRELGLTNAELIPILEEEGIEVKSHASTIEQELAQLVRDHVIAARQGGTSGTGEAETSGAGAGTAEQQGEEVADEDAVEVESEEETEEGAEALEEEGLEEIHIKPPVVVRDLAEKMGKKPNELIGQLMTLNVFATINQTLDEEVVQKLCRQNNFVFVSEKRSRARRGEGEAPAKKEKPSPEKATGGTTPRPPVVTFLGHVNHGKTSLQDAIRQTHVTSEEAGNITQHIGASLVEHEGNQITFLDTPGHEAFTAMRARGANVTDLVVLVVAADDGIMPQTIEAINHAKAAGVPIIVAVNKVDLPSANPQRIMMQLQEHDIHPEDWGGDIGVIRVSAETGEGLDELLERILLESEMLELGCSPDVQGEGTVIEAQLERGRGPTASILVTNGTLHVGDILLCGQQYGRIKAMMDDKGHNVKETGPATPVKVLGLSGVPNAGDRVQSGYREKEARDLAEQHEDEVRHRELTVDRHVTLEDLWRQIEEGARAELKIVLKTDVRGSLEAIADALNEIQSEKIQVNIIHRDVGEITENDALLAAASDAIVVGFNTRIASSVRRTAEENNVEVRLYNVIYELIEEIKDAMRGKLEPEVRETKIGTAEVQQVFHVSRTGRIAGCIAREGTIRRGAGAELYRNGELIYKGRIHSLRRFQDDVREVRGGLECGIRLDNCNDLQEGDVIEAMETEKLPREL